MQKGWIAFFQEWLLTNQARLNHENIRVEVIGITPYAPSSIHAGFYAERHEATVQLWEDGQSDFHFLDWEAAQRDPEVGVVVTHHDFTMIEELYIALDGLINRMSPALAAR
jgi:sugar phosphate isomerase/epimerase